MLFRGDDEVDLVFGFGCYDLEGDAVNIIAPPLSRTPLCYWLSECFLNGHTGVA